MLNIALEGLILTGAFFSIVFAAATGSLLVGDPPRDPVRDAPRPALRRDHPVPARERVHHGPRDEPVRLGVHDRARQPDLQDQGRDPVPHRSPAAGARRARRPAAHPRARRRAVRSQRYRVRHVADRDRLGRGHLPHAVRAAPARHGPEPGRPSWRSAGILAVTSSRASSFRVSPAVSPEPSSRCSSRRSSPRSPRAGAG